MSDTPVRLDLPRVYDWRYLLEVVFTGDEDAFLDAYVGQGPDALAPAVRQVVYETAGTDRLTVWLLRRLVRQQAEILRAWGPGEGT